MVDDGCFSVGKTIPCLPPMTGNGANIPQKKIYGDDWGMVGS